MMKKIKYICWDMDGTIADLYAVEGWEAKLNAHDAEPYKVAKAIHDMKKLAELMHKAQEKGIEIHITTWLAKNTDHKYNKEVRQAKKAWLARNGFPYDKFHGVKFGTTKANCIRKEIRTNQLALLIDDNAKVRRGWNLGAALDPTRENFLEALEKILEKI